VPCFSEIGRGWLAHGRCDGWHNVDN
jgi:hypothetical protein